MWLEPHMLQTNVLDSLLATDDLSGAGNAVPGVDSLPEIQSSRALCDVARWIMTLSWDENDVWQILHLLDLFRLNFAASSDL